jgi:uncharacterized phage-associated protein
MATSHDVAAYILQKQGEMSAMKLQKLVYYAQAWHLVWEDRPLFKERIEAWSNGPVVRELYNRHRGQFMVKTWSAGDPAGLTPKERQTIDVVLSFYGDKSAHWLSELTHVEPPWADARRGLSPAERGEREISKAAMVEYYSGLVATGS